MNITKKMLKQTIMMFLAIIMSLGTLSIVSPALLTSTINALTEDEAANVICDPQPATMDDVQRAIDIYIAADYAPSAKPRWEFEVAGELVPAGWRCSQIADGQLDILYWTIFSAPITTPDLVISSGNAVDLYNAVQNAPAGATIINITSDITLNGLNYPVTNNSNEDIALTAAIVIPWGKSITIMSDNNSKLIKSTPSTTNMSYRHFAVKGTLTLQSITLTGEGKGGGVDAVPGSATTDGGIFFMKEGALIENCYSETQGGGVQIASHASFIMDGGMIRNCITNKNSGGGVSVYGQAYETPGDFSMAKFVMNGGTISGNKATSAGSQGGGGVLVNAANATMNGGIITGNETSGSGGGVRIVCRAGEILSSRFTMNGGTISDNTSLEGGGVIVLGQGGGQDGGGASFKMNGGVITGNRSLNIGNGGGVAVINAYSSFTMSNLEGASTITNNSAGYEGGGIFLNGGVFSMDGGEIGSSGSPNKAQYGGGVFVGNGIFILNAGSVNYNEATTGNGGGINISNGTFTMKGGIIRGNNVQTGTHGGGGVAVSSGTFEMYKGEIYENTSGAGSGVLITSSTQAKFIMYDGLIHDNIQNYTGTYGGGGVYVDTGEFTMNGGNIYNNLADNTGGGVRVTVGGKFTMDGDKASIAGNHTKVDGGGVYIHNGGTFILINGLIDKNTAAGNGGGVYVNNGSGSSTFSMTGGMLSGNTANKHGGGVYINATFNMNAGSVSYNAASTGNGGGVYVPKSGKATMGSVKISGNSAPNGDGGGIYTETATYLATGDYTNLTIAETALFSDNGAKAAYIYNGTPAAGNIASRSASFNFPAGTTPYITHPLNNFDINYINDTPLEVYMVIVEYKDNMGFDLLPPIAGHFVKDTEYTYTVPAVDGYAFAGWRLNGVEESDINPTISFTVTDNTFITLVYERVARFSFYKVDSTDYATLLPGAEFKLYFWAGAGVPNVLVNVDTENSDWKLKETHTSDSGGYVDFGLLRVDAIYQLVETKAPDGYQLPLGQWRITAKDNGTINNPAAVGDHLPPGFKNTGTNDNPIYSLGNLQQYFLPLSGGQGVLLLTILGSLMLAGGVVCLSILFRRRLSRRPPAGRHAHTQSK